MSVRQRSGEMGQDAPLFPDSRARAVLAAGMAKAAAVRTGGKADVAEARIAGLYSKHFRDKNKEWEEKFGEQLTGVSAQQRAAEAAAARKARLEELIRNRDLADAERIANAWKRETADDGRVYWWNGVTGETTWNEQVPLLGLVTGRSNSEVGAKVEPVDYKRFYKIVIEELKASQGRPGKEEEIIEEIRETPLLTPEEASSWVAKQGNNVAWGKMLTQLLLGSGIGLPLMIRLYNLATENGGSVDYSGNDSGNYSGGYSGNYSGGYSGNDSGGFLPPQWAEPPYLAAAYNGAPGADVDAVVRRKGRDERWSAI